MIPQHQQLDTTWKQLSLPEQMAHIGSEVFRTLRWREKDRPDRVEKAFYRSLELFDQSKSSDLRPAALKEICRAREIWTDFIAGDNEFHSTREQWEKYFYQFTYLARKDR
jgi:hypothetical protein